MEVQGVGRFALLRDPQGAFVYFIQIAPGAYDAQIGVEPRRLLASRTRYTVTSYTTAIASISSSRSGCVIRATWIPVVMQDTPGIASLRACR